MTPTEKLIDIAKQFNLVNISNVALKNPKFPIWSGSSKPHQHHYRKGGLAEHTLEVVELCLQTNNYFCQIGATEKEVEEKHLFLAALFHDVGKMWDYEPVLNSQNLPDVKTVFSYDKWKDFSDFAQWTGTDHKRNIHHISRSALVWNEAINKFPEEFNGNSDDILHAILAHHGFREFGSPVSPNSRLAWLIHLCDGISARMDDVDRWDHTKL